ncbi:HFX_2341 family transcriptional regulator domain-containing protein [Halosimplex sp. J119]
MRTIDEVHVVPLGYEHDRILRPVRKHDADVVYLLAPDGEHTPLTPYQQALVEELEGDGRTIRYRQTDLDDLYDVLAVVTTVAADHENDVVRVNVSSGGKLAAIGSAIACMATDATAYYVRVDEHVPNLESNPRTRGMNDDIVLPSYPIEAVSRDQVAILDYLETTNDETYTAKKSDLIEYAESERLSFIADADPANDKAKFALLNANVVDPLAEDGYIAVEQVGRQKQIRLTETGENVLHAFRHKL